jgi:hypothetical protein
MTGDSNADIDVSVPVDRESATKAVVIARNKEALRYWVEEVRAGIREALPGKMS